MLAVEGNRQLEEVLSMVLMAACLCWEEAAPLGGAADQEEDQAECPVNSSHQTGNPDQDHPWSLQVHSKLARTKNLGGGDLQFSQRDA